MTQIALPLDPPVEFIRHPRARRYVVRVRPDGSVRVTMPRWGSRRDAEAFAREQRHWIDKQLLRVVQERRALGAGLAPDEILRYRQLASETLPSRLRDLAARFGLTVAAVSVRDQRWRWGSCSPSGRISLNWRLVRMPDSVRDYVIIHELMHLKRLDHSHAFWKLVADACPAYEDARRWLRQHQAGLT
jgi:predicted metal-dependent hydrolase